MLSYFPDPDFVFNFFHLLKQHNPFEQNAYPLLIIDLKPTSPTRNNTIVKLPNRSLFKTFWKKNLYTYFKTDFLNLYRNSTNKP